MWHCGIGITSLVWSGSRDSPLQPFPSTQEVNMHATRTIADVMTRGAHTLSPDDSVIRAAQAMESLDVGALPVCDAQHNL
ncbi:CBS domain-containing protein, partial [Acinetobacter baumannii]